MTADLTHRFHADSVGRAFDVIGDHWTLMILREAFFGVRRYGQLARNLGIPRPTLSARLRSMVESGLLERVPYSSDPDRYEYRLTAAGRDLHPVTVVLLQWGDKYLAGPEGPPLVLRHHDCGELAEPSLICGVCGKEITAHNVTPEPGPAFRDWQPDLAPGSRPRQHKEQRVAVGGRKGQLEGF